MPCSICSSFQRPSEEEAVKDFPEFPDRPELMGYEGSSQRRRFRRSNVPFGIIEKSADDCYTCNVLLEGCYGCLERQGIRRESAVAADVRMDFDEREDDDYGGDCEKLVTIRLANGDQIPIEIFTLPDESCPCPDSWDEIHTYDRATQQTSSDEALDRTQAWLRECRTNHDFCEDDKDTELPTRLIDVGLHGGPIKLLETGNNTDRYVSLSHCWGKAQIVTTTKQTIEDRKRAIPWGVLSQTFADAIQLTRRLNVMYIWIDSLCIVQDDPMDWAKESANMASIFRNSSLTIAATRSSGGHGGLFAANPDFEVSGRTPLGEDFRLFFRRKVEHTLVRVTELESTYPLFNRAWVFQERLLSPRVLHFGPFELFFECRTDASCECGALLGADVVEPQPKATLAEALDGDASGYYLACAWRAMAMQYSDLDLTFAKDRLPALGGLARAVSEVRQSRYLAGLWEESLHDDLLWVGGGGGVRPPEWRAPTWSWASVVCPIYYSDAPLFWQSDEAKETRGENIHYSRVERCECTPGAIDEFGTLNDGLLQLSGLCATATIQYHLKDETSAPTPSDQRSRGSRPMVCLNDGTAFPFLEDYSLREPGRDIVAPNSEVLCIRMSSLMTGSGRRLCSLVLKPLDPQRQLFERIGLLRIWHDGDDDVADMVLYKSAQQRTITIV